MQPTLFDLGDTANTTHAPDLVVVTPPEITVEYSSDASPADRLAARHTDDDLLALYLALQAEARALTPRIMRSYKAIGYPQTPVLDYRLEITRWMYTVLDALRVERTP